MAISPPTDIVLDVARAADPAAIETAKAELAKRSSAASAAEFGNTLLRGDMSVSTLDASRIAKKPDDPFVKFEAMVMQSFIQSMLPKDTATVYGEGMAGEMWQGLMAEQMAGVIAERGGIGIADRMLRNHYVEGEKIVAVNEVPTAAAQSKQEDTRTIAKSMVDEMQRKLTSGLISDTAASNSK